MLERIAENINLLGAFLGKRDISDLTPRHLWDKYGIWQADVMVLFGGSILCGGDVLAEGMKQKIAKKYVIVGGAGHTTKALRDRVHKEFPVIETEDLSETEIFSEYIKLRYGLTADYLECHSTNCGNNITYLLDLLKSNHVSYDSMIISQDAAMQYRMEAGLRKYEKDITIINYAAYSARVIVRHSELGFEKDIHGMWDMERYISLLLGEIPRLTDDQNGYGPKGKNYIAHVDIPESAANAFTELSAVYSRLVREANPAYASK